MNGVAPRAALAGAVLYAALTLWFLWPLPTALSTHLLYEPNAWDLIAADADFVLWAMSWTAHALVHDPVHLFDANIFYPMPHALALSDHMLGHQPVFAPVFLATGNPVLAGNVLLLSEHWLAAMGAFLLATRFMPAAPALVAGSAYAFLAVRRSGLVHPHVLAVGWMPLVLFFADRWLERARLRDAASMATCLALQLLCSFYLAYMVLIGWICALPILLLRWRDRLDARRLGGGLAACLVAALPFLLASIPYAVLRRDGFLPSFELESGGRAELVAGLAPGAAWTILLSKGAGPVALVLTLVGLLPPWRRRSVLALAMSMVAGGWLIGRGPADLALGPVSVTSPYRFLQEWLPGFSSIRVPDRILNVAELGIALLAGLGTSRLLAVLGIPRRIAFPIAGGLAAAIVALPWPSPEKVLHPRDVGERAPEAARWLAENGDGRPLLELPPRTFRKAAQRMLVSTAHWLPLFDGYTSHPPPVHRYLAWRSRDLPRHAALSELLRDSDVGWILVHEAELFPAARARWRESEVSPALELVAEFGTDRLFRVRERGPARPGSPLYDGERTPEGASRAPLGPSCPGRLEIVPPPDQLLAGGVVAPGAGLRFTVRVANDGDRPWPGGGLHPKGQVRLRTCITKPRALPAAPCAEARTLLLADVAPHATLEVDEVLVVPKTPDDYLLWADLVQIGVGPLAGCGVAPVSVPFTVRERKAERRNEPSPAHAADVRAARAAQLRLGARDGATTVREAHLGAGIAADERGMERDGQRQREGR